MIIKDGFTYALATADGVIKVEQAPMIRCLYTFVVVGGKGHLQYLLNAAGDTLSPVVDNCKIYEDTVGESRVFCFPAYSPGLERYSCAELRNWGMMDERGKWVIEPKFDKPFHFDGGVALVWYLGLPRQIDEEGRFLEDQE